MRERVHNVLIVSSDPVIGKLIATPISERWHIEPIRTSNFRTAIDLYSGQVLAGRRVDVAIVEVDETDPTQAKGFVEQILQIAHDNGIPNPMVIAAGWSRDADEARTELGAVGYIKMPSQNDIGVEVINTLDQALKKV